MDNYTVDSSLLSNGLDFLTMALQNMDNAEFDQKCLKYATLHLWSGIHLILKARLEKENWKLVVSKINAVSFDRYKKGNFQSVSFEETLERLERFCQIKFSPDSLSIFGNLRTLRNKIEHSHFCIKKTEILKLFSQSLDLILEILKSYKSDYGFDRKEIAAFDVLLTVILHSKLVINSRLDLTQDLLALDMHIEAFCTDCQKVVNPFRLSICTSAHRLTQLEVMYWNGEFPVYSDCQTNEEYYRCMCKLCGIIQYEYVTDLMNGGSWCLECGRQGVLP